MSGQMRTLLPGLLLVAAVTTPLGAQSSATSQERSDPTIAPASGFECPLIDPGVPTAPQVIEPELPEEEINPYASIESRHRMKGRACYYSAFFDGRKTASGEIFRVKRFTAAHLTLPLGTWVEVTSLSTGKKIRVKVNDRGPYSGGFVIDLSPAAARSLGVDRAKDRRVEMRVLALPGEELPQEDLERETDTRLAQAEGSVTQNVEP